MLSCTAARRLATLFAVLAVAIVSMPFNGAGPATAATHPAAFVWTGTTTRTTGGWELDSPNGVYRAVFQADHNLVVYHGSRAIWASHTNGETIDTLVFSGPAFRGLKGNVGVYVYCTTPCTFPAGTRQWNNRVNNAAATHRVTMQNDGNFVEYTGSSGGTALWATNTVGK